MVRHLLVVLLMLAALSAPVGAVSVVVDLLLANVWSFTAHSKTLLADQGYEMEYLFEFIDEEELRVRGTGESEIREGRIRTILEGDPVEATIGLRNETRSLHIARDVDRLVAAWQVDGRLVAADLPLVEINRRWTLLLTLLRETRRRLNLEGFSPDRDYVVPLPVLDLDILALIPAKPTPQRYEIHRPGRAEAVELLITEAGGKRWEVTWGMRQLRVRTSPPLDPARTLAEIAYTRGRTTVLQSEKPIAPEEEQRLVVKGFNFLESARTYFGTAPITAALPNRRPR